MQRTLSKTVKKLHVSRRHVVYGVLMTVLLFISCASLLRLSPYKPSNGTQYFRAKVVAVSEANAPSSEPIQNVQVKLLDGPQKNQTVSVQRGIAIGDSAAKRLPVGSEVLLLKDNGSSYTFLSRWFMPGIATLFIALLALVVVIGTWRGITSIFGLSVSIFILATFVVPQIIHGHSAFATCVEGAVLITLASMYIAHGLSKRTTVAFVGALVTLAAVIGLTALASYITGTSEIIDDNASTLFSAGHSFDLAGLLTGGVVIASLGTLFDITTGQAATVDEIHKADHTQSTNRLFWKGMSVGREHIAALINTLALVYVGVALPSIVMTILLNQQSNFHAPLLVNLNTETIAEEVVRTCVASIGMLLALPITTWLAAYILPQWSANKNAKTT